MSLSLSYLLHLETSCLTSIRLPRTQGRSSQRRVEFLAGRQTGQSSHPGRRIHNNHVLLFFLLKSPARGSRKNSLSSHRRGLHRGGSFRRGVRDMETFGMRLSMRKLLTSLTHRPGVYTYRKARASHRHRRPSPSSYRQVITPGPRWSPSRVGRANRPAIWTCPPSRPNDAARLSVSAFVWKASWMASRRPTAGEAEEYTLGMYLVRVAVYFSRFCGLILVSGIGLQLRTPVPKVHPRPLRWAKIMLWERSQRGNHIATT